MLVCAARLVSSSRSAMKLSLGAATSRTKTKRTAAAPCMPVLLWHLFVCPLGVRIMLALSRAHKEAASQAAWLLLLMMIVCLLQHAHALLPSFSLYTPTTGRQDRHTQDRLNGGAAVLIVARAASLLGALLLLSLPGFPTPPLPSSSPTVNGTALIAQRNPEQESIRRAPRGTSLSDAQRSPYIHEHHTTS